MDDGARTPLVHWHIRLILVPCLQQGYTDRDFRLTAGWIRAQITRLREAGPRHRRRDLVSSAVGRDHDCQE